MPRTWSNARVTDTRSAAQRMSNRPSNLTAFVIFLSLIVIFFMGLMTIATYRVMTHPSIERNNTETHEPEQDH